MGQGGTLVENENIDQVRGITSEFVSVEIGKLIPHIWGNSLGISEGGGLAAMKYIQQEGQHGFVYSGIIVPSQDKGEQGYWLLDPLQDNLGS